MSDRKMVLEARRRTKRIIYLGMLFSIWTGFVVILLWGAELSLELIAAAGVGYLVNGFFGLVLAEDSKDE